MLKRIWLKALDIGIRAGYTRYLRSKIRACNGLSILAIILSLAYAIFSIQFGIIAFWIPFSVVLIAFLSIILNHFNHHSSARFIIGVFPSLAISAFHAYHISPDENIILISFFTQLAFALLPWILADLREVKLLYSSAIICLIPVIFQEQINLHFPWSNSHGFYEKDLVNFLNFIVNSAIIATCLLTLQNSGRHTEKAIQSDLKKAELNFKEAERYQKEFIEKEKMKSLSNIVRNITYEIEAGFKLIQQELKLVKDSKNNINSAKTASLQEEITSVNQIITGLNKLSQKYDVDQKTNLDLHSVIKTSFSIINAGRSFNIDYQHNEALKNITVYCNEALLIQAFVTLFQDDQSESDSKVAKVQIEVNALPKEVSIHLLLKRSLNTVDDQLLNPNNGNGNFSKNNLVKSIISDLGGTFNASSEESPTSLTICLPKL